MHLRRLLSNCSTSHAPTPRRRIATAHHDPNSPHHPSLLKGVRVGVAGEAAFMMPTHMQLHMQRPTGSRGGMPDSLDMHTIALMAASWLAPCKCTSQVPGVTSQTRLARTHPTSMAASAACTCRCTCVASSATPLTAHGPTAPTPIVPTLLPTPLHCQRLVDHSTALGPQQLPLHHCSALVFSTLYQGGSAHRLPRSHREQVQAAPSSNPSVDNASTLAWTLTSRRP